VAVPFLEQEIMEKTEETWHAMLGLDLNPGDRPAGVQPGDGFLTGKVEVEGSWEGVILLHASFQLAKTAAMGIFGYEADHVTEQDTLDALYELTNIIGGNIVSRLSGTCRLSLPCVEPTQNRHLRITGAEPVCELNFVCRGQPLLVKVWKRKNF
jgi:CheY-specific phosphatase CheX